MKLLEKENKIKLSEGLEEIQFGIIFNRKMADILSNKLYSDKVLAVVREYSTNAREGHVFNGNEDKSFDVCLPTWTDSTFYIRDYGIGMSPQKIEENVTQYGWSDKDNTNDVEGALGLGFKVGFAYHTRTFTVDSWFSGRHYIYQCYLNQEGMPCMTEMANEPSNEPSGIKITIEVAPGEYDKFHDAAQKVYTYFPVKPNFIGHKIEIEEPSYVLNGDGWSLRPNGDCPRAIMGVLAYPIQCDSLNNGKTYDDILDCPFDIDFDLGSLDIEASREGLGYDDRTKQHIRNKLDKVVEECGIVIQEKIEQSKNLWEARCSYFTLRDNVPLSAFRVVDWSKVEYNGVRLFPTDAGNVMLTKLVKNERVKVTRFANSRYSYKWGRYKIRNSEVSKVPANLNALFYTNDNGKSYIRKATYKREKEGQSGNDVFVFTFKDNAAKQEVFDELGLDESYFSKITDLEEPPKDRGGSSGSGVAKKTRVMKFNRDNNSHRKNEYWEDTSVTLENAKDIMYVETCRYDIRYKGRTIDPEKLTRFIVKLKENGIKSPEIVGVKKADLKKAKNIPNFLDWALDKAASPAYNYSGKQLSHDRQELREAFDTWGRCLYESDFRKISKLLPEDHFISILIGLIDEIKKEVESLGSKENLRNIVRYFGVKEVESDFPIIKRGLVEERKRILKTYPMLNMARNTSNKESVKILADYINLIDKGENNG